MPRYSRIVLPGHPHHVTQRGNRRQTTFFDQGDFDLYRALLRKNCRECGVKVLGYCLMPNHIHLVVIPQSQDGLARGIGETHRTYTWLTNRKQGWTGCLWQGRFFSCLLGDTHFLPALKYVELNPVRAGLVAHPEEYPWSSARAHLYGGRDPLLDSFDGIPNAETWTTLMRDQQLNKDALEKVRSHIRTGWPLGSEDFLQQLKTRLGRSASPAKRGRPQARDAAQ